MTTSRVAAQARARLDERFASMSAVSAFAPPVREPPAGDEFPSIRS